MFDKFCKFTRYLNRFKRTSEKGKGLLATGLKSSGRWAGGAEHKAALWAGAVGRKWRLGRLP
jgi:hypothetical protein